MTIREGAGHEMAGILRGTRGSAAKFVLAVILAMVLAAGPAGAPGAD